MIARVLAACLVTAAAAHAGEELELPELRRVGLDNGMTVLLGASRELALVQLSVLVPVGAAHDTDAEAGLATLTAEALQRGAGPYDAVAFARAVESIGGTISTGVGNDATTVQAEFLAEDVARAVELLRLVIREPRFEAEEVRRARDEQAASVAGIMERPQLVIERCFAAALYGSHPYGRSVYGSRATLERLDAGAVRRFHARWYQPHGTTLTVVGDVDVDHVEGLVRTAFGDWRACEHQADGGLGGVARRLLGRRAACHVDPAPRPPVPVAPPGGRVVLVDKPDATQAQIRLGALAMARNDPDLLTATVANTVLGGGFSSILMDELRIKRSLTYGARSGFATRLVGGDFRVSTSTKTETTLDAIELARAVLASYREHGPDPDHLARAQAYLRGQFPLSLETIDAVAGQLVEQEFYGLPADHLVTYRRRVAATTHAQATAAARAHMPAPDALTIVVLGPRAALEAPLRAALGPLTVVPAAACEDPQAALAE